MRYRIVFTEPARADLHTIYVRSREFYPAQTVNFRSAFRAALSRIAEAPLRFSIWQPPNYRRWLLTPYPYMIIYHTDDWNIVIDSIRHQRQDPKTLIPRP